jgi:putative ABC transport system permease protein
MLKNLFTIAWRNIRKDKTYSAINILGLTIGITCSMFLLMYILDELSYDRYHKQAKNIYRIVSHIREPDNAFTWAVAQDPLAIELRENYPEVINAVRFNGFGAKRLFKYNDKEFYEDNIFTADSTAFDMFSYKMISGDPNTALDQPFSIVLTQKMATKYFGEKNPVGEVMQNQDNETFKVTGVLEDVPLNSHFLFDALVSSNTRGEQNTSWGGFGVFTYVQLPEGYDLKRMYTNLDKILKEKVEPIFQQYNITIKYELQPITDIHLYSKIQDEAEAGGDISSLYAFGAIAVFMLIIASINYMNLATARSVNRAKEVGIRKVMGSMRGQLIAQFITESVVITLISLAVSLLLIYALLPVFNELSSKQLPFAYVLQPPVLLSLLGIVLVIGVLGGSYPALYLSGFNPVSVLKGKLSAKGGNAVFRKMLVVVQFSISIFMLISTLVVYDQLQYMRNKDLGFDKERVVRILLVSDDQADHVETIAERMRQTKGVASAASSNTSPGLGIGKRLLQVEDNDGKLSERGVDLFEVDYDFIKTLGMSITQGRDFSRDVVSDTLHAAIVNEAMVRRMSWTNPLGKKFILKGGGPNGTDVERQVIGVVKDYHQNSLYDAIEPLMIYLDLKNSFLFIKTEEGDVRESLAAIENTWKELYPNYPFDYQFLDQDFNSQYKADEQKSQIFTVFSGLTIVIACLGLLGLAAFTTEQRYKEIGVRKVIGASISGLVVLVAKEFFVLVGIGTIIAYPLAWYFTSNWLQGFAYQISLSGEWLTFLLSALLAFVITFATVGYHVLRAASANPVKALRDE